MAAVVAGLAEAWRDELFGRALMRRLRTTLADGAAHDAELRWIERVETLMAAALATALDDPDVRFEASAAEERARTVAARFVDWSGFATASVEAMGTVLDRFHALEAHAPPSLRPLARLLVEHEEGLDRYLRAAAAGRAFADNDALTDVERALRAFLADRRAIM